jgi:hypothetical protein
MDGHAYTLTSRSVSARADCTPQYVTKLARAGRLDHLVASNGTRLFPPTAPAEVRRQKAESAARRGRTATP